MEFPVPLTPYVVLCQAEWIPDFHICARGILDHGLLSYPLELCETIEKRGKLQMWNSILYSHNTTNGHEVVNYY